MPGLTQVQFATGGAVGDESVDEIVAHENGIAIHTGHEEPTVFLDPRHIEAIVSMHGDWWDSHWAVVHEQQA